MKINWDILGVTTSIVCAIHCAALPILLTTLPVFGVDIVHNLFFEWGMILLALIVGIYSLYHGYIKHHHSLISINMFIVGFLFLILKQFFHQYEMVFLTIAVLLIILAHYYNYKMCHKTNCSSKHHQH